MKVGIAQLNSNDSVTDNFEQIKSIIESSKSEKPAIIFFPENSLFFRIDASTPVQAIKLSDPIILKLAELAKAGQVALHLTTAVNEGGKIFNASIMIGVTGEIQVVYRKMHLFDIALWGQKPIRESDTFVHGVINS